MTHYGLLCPAASGHLNPMTTLGHALRRRGHRVTLVAIPDGRARALAAGLEFAPIAAEDYPEGSTRALFARLGELSGPAAFRATVDHFQRSTRLILRDTPATLRQLGVEALLIDQTSFGGASIAQALDLPFVSVSCALLLNQDPDVPPVNTGWRYRRTWWARLRNRLGYELLGLLARPISTIVLDYRRQQGLAELSDPSQAWSPLAQICQPGSPGELPPEAPTDPYVTLSRHTAPVIQPQPAHHANGQTSQVAVGQSAPEAHDYGDACAAIFGASAAARRPAPDSGS